MQQRIGAQNIPSANSLLQLTLRWVLTTWKAGSREAPWQLLYLSLFTPWVCEGDEWNAASSLCHLTKGCRVNLSQQKVRQLINTQASPKILLNTHFLVHQRWHLTLQTIHSPLQLLYASILGHCQFRVHTMEACENPQLQYHYWIPEINCNKCALCQWDKKPSNHWVAWFPAGYGTRAALRNNSMDAPCSVVLSDKTWWGGGVTYTRVQVTDICWQLTECPSVVAT